MNKKKRSAYTAVDVLFEKEKQKLRAPDRILNDYPKIHTTAEIAG